MAGYGIDDIRDLFRDKAALFRAQVVNIGMPSANGRRDSKLADLHLRAEAKSIRPSYALINITKISSSALSNLTALGIYKPR